MYFTQCFYVFSPGKVVLRQLSPLHCKIWDFTVGFLPWPGTCLSLYPYFFWCTYLSPYALKSSHAELLVILPLFFCTYNYFFLVLCLHLHWENFESRGWSYGFAGLALSSCSSIDYMSICVTYWLWIPWGQWQCLSLHFFLRMEPDSQQRVGTR